MRLSKLFENVTPQEDREIRSLAMDSRVDNPDGIFFCIEGLTSDGHCYAEQAAAKGATVIVHSKPVKEVPGVVYRRVDDVPAEMNRVTDLFYGQPSRNLTVYAVTGTNGKTTISVLIQKLLAHYESCAYNGTVGTSINGELVQGIHMTTPDNIALTRLLAEVRDAGCQSIAMEISSHALDQCRADNVDIDVAIFTNLTLEHLDYHKTMEAYCEAKQKMFRNLKPDAVAVLNRDDAYYEAFRSVCPCRTVSYGMHEDADYRITDLRLSATGTRFNLCHGGNCYPLETDLVSEINMYNLAAALAAVHERGHDLAELAGYARVISPQIGRFQALPNDYYNLIVDFAHTPDGFEKIFRFAQSITPQGHRIFAVFGSAGRRDFVKRPVLGEVADRYCDRIVLCEDDPRDEDPLQIAEEIKGGITHLEKVDVIADREAAIHFAVEEAEPGDTILMLAKALDRFIPRKNGEEPWIGDDQAALDAVREKHGSLHRRGGTNGENCNE